MRLHADRFGYEPVQVIEGIAEDTVDVDLGRIEIGMLRDERLNLLAMFFPLLDALLANFRVEDDFDLQRRLFRRFVVGSRFFRADFEEEVFDVTVDSRRKFFGDDPRVANHWIVSLGQFYETFP